VHVSRCSSSAQRVPRCRGLPFGELPDRAPLTQDRLQGPSSEYRPAGGVQPRPHRERHHSVGAGQLHQRWLHSAITSSSPSSTLSARVHQRVQPDMIARGDHRKRDSSEISNVGCSSPQLTASDFIGDTTLRAWTAMRGPTPDHRPSWSVLLVELDVDGRVAPRSNYSERPQASRGPPPPPTDVMFVPDWTSWTATRRADRWIETRGVQILGVTRGAICHASSDQRAATEQRGTPPPLADRAAGLAHRWSPRGCCICPWLRPCRAPTSERETVRPCRTHS